MFAIKLNNGTDDRMTLNWLELGTSSQVEHKCGTKDLPQGNINQLNIFRCLFRLSKYSINIDSAFSELVRENLIRLFGHYPMESHCNSSHNVIYIPDTAMQSLPHKNEWHHSIEEPDETHTAYATSSTTGTSDWQNEHKNDATLVAPNSRSPIQTIALPAMDYNAIMDWCHVVHRDWSTSIFVARSNCYNWWTSTTKSNFFSKSNHVGSGCAVIITKF